MDDFARYYEIPKSRKDITNSTYRIEDCLQGIQITNGYKDVVVDRTAAIPLFDQQLAIVKTLRDRFADSIYDIRLHLQAEMFDDELEAAAYLLKNHFQRAAGAVAGVVLERHLKQVCDNHQISCGTKKNLTLSDFNDKLKDASIIDTSEWRRIQFLGDIRNKCDHAKTDEPTPDEVKDLIDGVQNCKESVLSISYNYLYDGYTNVIS